MYVKYSNGKYNVSVYVQDEGKFKYVNMLDECYYKILTLCGVVRKPPHASHNLKNVRSLILNRTKGYFIINEDIECFEIKHYIKQSDDIDFFLGLEIL